MSRWALPNTRFSPMQDLRDMSRRALRRGDASGEETKAAIAKWRATVPWTDEQIAEVYDNLAVVLETTHYQKQETPKHRQKRIDKCRTIAAQIRRGFLSSRMLSAHVLDALIKTCSICGKVAHYRVGRTGRCREHKMVDIQGLHYQRHLAEQKSAAIRAEEKADDERKRRHDNARRTLKWG